MNATEIPGEPRLSPGFAQRVLRRADLVIARRRRMRRLALGSAAAVVIALAIVSGTRMLVPGAKTPGRQPDQFASTDTGNGPPAPGEQTDPLSTMFPDAAPVALFARQYADATEDSGDLLFADDTTESGQAPD